MKNHPDCYAENLIEELFRNNKDLLSNANEVKEFTNRVINIVNDLEWDNYKSSKYLMSLISLMRNGNKVIKNNQTLVLNILTKPEYD